MAPHKTFFAPLRDELMNGSLILLRFRSNMFRSDKLYVLSGKLIPGCPPAAFRKGASSLAPTPLRLISFCACVKRPHPFHTCEEKVKNRKGGCCQKFLPEQVKGRTKIDELRLKNRPYAFLYVYWGVKNCILICSLPLVRCIGSIVVLVCVILRYTGSRIASVRLPRKALSRSIISLALWRSYRTCYRSPVSGPLSIKVKKKILTFIIIYLNF